MIKIYSATKVFPFKANYSQDLQMGFEGRRKGKFEAAEKFVKRMKKIQEEAKAVLEKVQEKMKKYTDRKQGEEEEYKVRDPVVMTWQNS